MSTKRKVVFSLFVTGFFVAVAVGLYHIREYYKHFLRREADYYQSDPVAGHVHRPNAKRTFSWPEHPDGRIIMSTNNLGFREDGDTPAQKATNSFRVLVTGDSHMDGVVNNGESFANQLESLLNRAGSPDRVYEVINGGTGYYTFQNYSGFLEKHLHLEPDLFIVTVFTGNDFLETVTEDARNYQIFRAAKRLYYRLSLPQKSPGVPLGQGLSQIIYFKLFPEMRSEAVKIGLREFERIGRLCEQHEIRLLIILLPTKYDLEPGTLTPETMESLDLAKGDMDITRDMARSLGQSIEAKEIAPVFDPSSPMRASSGPFYWASDHHLNHDGHRFLAAEVSRVYGELLR